MMGNDVDVIWFDVFFWFFVVEKYNIFFIENFILEYIINDSVFFYNDMFCCVFGMLFCLFIFNVEF